MSQRPSPHSIGTCALIALYSDPNSPLLDLLIPVDGPNGEDGTATIASFLESSVIGRRSNGTTTTTTTATTTLSAATSLSHWMRQLQTCQTVDGTTSTMASDVAQLLLETLRRAAESVDALMDLMGSLQMAVHQEGLVDTESLNGVYLRQVCLGFDELSFESVAILWQSFKQEVEEIVLEPSSSTKSGDSEDDQEMASTVPKKDTQIAMTWKWPLSTEQLHEMLRRDCVYFQHDSGGGGGGTHTRRQKCSFEDMEVYIREMLENEPELPEAHFLRYLNCLRHGERTGALDALHQYFDHAMVQHVPSPPAASSRPSGSPAASPASSDILQFSAILLAMTHSTFGDSNLALMATEEAVRVAQQSKDSACVAFALGWLYEHHGQGTADRRELLERCVARASAAGISAAAANAPPGHPHHLMHHHHQMTQTNNAANVRAQQLRPLVAGAHLALARHDLLDEDRREGGLGETSSTGGTTTRGRSSAYARAWSNLLQVTAEPTTDPTAMDRPTHLTPNPGDTRESMARQQLVSAAIWNAVGMTAMSEWASKSTLVNLPDDLSYDDMVTAIQNISRLALYGTPPLSHEDVQTRRTGPTMDGLGGRSTPSRRPCVYATAVSTLTRLRKELGMEGNDLEEPILHNLALTLHEWAVNRGELDDAKALQRALNSYLHPGLNNYHQLRVDIKMQRCLFLCHTQDWDGAKTTAKQALDICKKAGFASHTRARILLQIALIQLEADPLQCTAALPSLLEALTLCEQRQIQTLHAVGISIMAQVFLRLSNPQRSIALLEASIPTLLQREHVWFQAEAYRTIAKANMNLAVEAAAAAKTKNTAAATGVMALPATSRKRYLKALQALTKSGALFEDCQDCSRLQEILYLQSHVYSILGDLDQREVAADLFFRVGKHLESGSNQDGGILDAMGDPVLLEALTHRVMY